MSAIAPGGLLTAMIGMTGSRRSKKSWRSVRRRTHADGDRDRSPDEVPSLAWAFLATSLPYPDETFDGAYLIGVLGEIPDRDAALRELRRVLKPHARLVVGEFFIDPDFVPLGSLRAHARLAGFAFQGKLGFPFAYFARFQRL